jgi:hypothetical protein
MRRADGRFGFAAVAAVAGVAVAAAIVLTGCVKLDMHLTVNPDDTVSGTYIVGVQKPLLALTNEDADALYKRLTAGLAPATLPTGAAAPGSVSAVKYDDGTYVGAKFTVSAVPIGQIGTMSAGDDGKGTSFSLTHEGGEYHFTGTLDATTASGPAASATTAPGTGGGELRLALTFPGEVIETNGDKDGSSVTWRLAFGQRVTLTATAKDHGAKAVSPLDRLLFTLATLSALALLVAVAITLLARRQHRHRPSAIERAAPATDTTTPTSGSGDASPVN